jgi:hypothetical protein
MTEGVMRSALMSTLPQATGDFAAGTVVIGWFVGFPNNCGVIVVAL